MLVDRATLRDHGSPCARVPPSGRMDFQNFARHPVLVNERCSAPCYRPQTLASNLAKSLTNRYAAGCCTSSEYSAETNTFVSTMLRGLAGGVVVIAVAIHIPPMKKANHLTLTHA